MSQFYGFTPATGPVDGYELDILEYKLDPGRHYLQLRVRAYADPEEGQEVVVGGWSEYSEPIYIPEPGGVQPFVALLVGLGFLYWWRKRWRPS